LLPRSPAITVDTDYVFAPAGLLADEYPETAVELMRHLHTEEKQP
jgi:hypothetical protein